MKSVTAKTIVGVLLFSLALLAQGNFGRILGIVSDQSGAVMPGVKVTVLDTQRGIARNLTSDQAGAYNAPNLIPGTYTVRVEAAGFKVLDRQNVLVEVGSEVRVDLTPQPGEQTQTVTITEAVPLVDTASATLGGTVNNAAINDMPLNGRNYQNLMSLRLCEDLRHPPCNYLKTVIISAYVIVHREGRGASLRFKQAHR